MRKRMSEKGSDIADFSRALEGQDRVVFAERFMPVLSLIRARFAKEQPLRGTKISACLHVTAETANLMRVLQAGGAEVQLCASNPLSTQDDIAAYLVSAGIMVFAIKSENNKTYHEHIARALLLKPDITMDDGADLVTTLVHRGRSATESVLGGTEETTTGVSRLRNMEFSGTLPYPVIAVNDAKTKHLFDNRYGTGQSTLDGIIRATNILIAGLCVVVSGFGWCGKGIAMRARGFGARVIVTEIDPLKALEAKMEGYEVMKSLNAAKVGDLFITVTGGKSVLCKEHFQAMKDGAMLANAGHFNVEIDMEALERISSARRTVRPLVEEFVLGEKRVFLLAEGRLVNLACGEGHPPAVMDMSFANQALSVEYLLKHQGKLSTSVHGVPEKIDRDIARLKLESLGIEIDKPTKEQSAYQNSWREGT